MNSYKSHLQHCEVETSMLFEIMQKGVVSMGSTKKRKLSLEIDMALESEIAMRIPVLNIRFGARSYTSQSQRTEEANPFKSNTLNMCNIKSHRHNDA
jgi:hypothetical protein